MTLEEIRISKALALLEYQEAQQLVDQLLRKACKLSELFSSVAHDLKANPLVLLEADEKICAEANAATAVDLAKQLNEAYQKLSEAKAKKNEFRIPDLPST
jgi:hypothetical protein